MSDWLPWPEPAGPRAWLSGIRPAYPHTIVIVCALHFLCQAGQHPLFLFLSWNWIFTAGNAFGAFNALYIHLQCSCSICHSEKILFTIEQFQGSSFLLSSLNCKRSSLVCHAYFAHFHLVVVCVHFARFTIHVSDFRHLQFGCTSLSYRSAQFPVAILLSSRVISFAATKLHAVDDR